MNKRRIHIVLGVAVIFGLLAVFLVNKWMSGRLALEKTITKSITPVEEIVVAAQEINIGVPINKNNLTMAEWPKSNVPKGCFVDIADVDGRVAVTRLVAGAPILDAELAAPGSAAGLIALIPHGKRAISIKVDEVVGVAGFIMPDTYVDVIGIDRRGHGKKEQASTILENIRVLAVAQDTLNEGGKPKVVRTVTLETTPKQAEKLALETHKGGVQLVLRNPLEKEKISPRPIVEVKHVIGKKTVRAIRPKVYVPKKNPFDVEIIRGGADREKIRFKNMDSEERG